MKGLGPEARALVEAASRQETLPSAQSLRRVRRSIAYKAMAASAAIATSSATMGAKAGLLGASVTLQLAALALGGALTGGALIAVSAPWRDAPRPSVSAVASRTVPPAGVASDTPMRAGEPTTSAPSENPAPAASVERDPAEPTVTSRAPTATGPNAVEPRERPLMARAAPRPAAPPLEGDAPIVPPARPATLALELSVLRQAREALRAGRGADVLVLLDQYESAFRAGALEEEARTARVAALCQLGREDEARLEMTAIARRWPNSPAATRLGCTRAEGATRSP